MMALLKEGERQLKAHTRLVSHQTVNLNKVWTLKEACIQFL
jgi:hypothetical protein